MKTRNLKEKMMAEGCLKIRHLSMFIIFTVLSAFIGSSSLLFSKEMLDGNGRSPSSVLEEELLTIPLEQKSFAKSMFVEDDAGVMRNMKETVGSWEARDQFVKTWDLESTGAYKTPDKNEKMKYVSKNMLKYVDKRLSGEIKNAEEGSTLRAVGNVEKSLRPSTTVGVSKNISLKFKARVLQGKMMMDVKNPWVDANLTVGVNGKARALTKKDFKKLGVLAGVEYNINDAQWVMFVDKEIASNVKARISSTTMPNGNDAERKVEIMASFPINL